MIELLLASARYRCRYHRLQCDSETQELPAASWEGQREAGWKLGFLIQANCWMLLPRTWFLPVGHPRQHTALSAQTALLVKLQCAATSMHA